jgi:hypothetical protein
MKKSLMALSAAVLVTAASVPARAATLEELQQQLSTLNQEVSALKQPKTDLSGDSALKKAWDKTKIGGYGELAFISTKENGNGNGGNTFDPKRIVLYVNSELNSWITFNAELEWEHGGSDGGISVEQAFLDFKLNRAFNVRAGSMLIPLGGVNQYHEPTNFNSTERPQLDTYLIPTTWQEMGIAIHGDLGDHANYQLMVSPGLNGDGFSAETGLREGRQDFGKDANRNLAVSGRLELNPATNLYTNFSFFTGNSAPSGRPVAYTTIAAFDGKYSLGDFDVMGEYVQVFQNNP